MPSPGRLRLPRARSCSPSFPRPTSHGAASRAPSKLSPLAGLLVVGGTDALLFGDGGQIVLLVLEVLLDLLVSRRLEELALFDLGQDLSARLRLLAALLARVG